MLHPRRFNCSIFVDPILKSELENAFTTVRNYTDGIVDITISQKQISDNVSFRELQTGETPMAAVYSHMVTRNGKEIDLLGAYSDDNDTASQVIKNITDGDVVYLEQRSSEVRALYKGDLGLTVKSPRIYIIPTNLGFYSNNRTFQISLLMDVQNWNFIYKKSREKMLDALINLAPR